MCIAFRVSNGEEKSEVAPRAEIESEKNRTPLLYRSRSTRVNPVAKRDIDDSSPSDDCVTNARKGSLVRDRSPVVEQSRPFFKPTERFKRLNIASEVMRVSGRSDITTSRRSEASSRVGREDGGSSRRGTRPHYSRSASTPSRTWTGTALEPYGYFARLARFLLPTSSKNDRRVLSGGSSVSGGREFSRTVPYSQCSSTFVHPIRILLVEDSVAIQKVMKHFLKVISKGIVTVANDGQEGLDLMKTKEFDLIITDFVMVRTYKSAGA